MPVEREPFETQQLAALVRGERAAMEAFFDHYYDRVFGYLVQALRDRALAEDLTQEAFLHMHRGLARLDTGRDPTPWVFTVAANVLRDHWRRRPGPGGRAAASLEQLEAVADEGAAGADHGMVEAEEHARVHRAMEGLSPADREILVLRAWEGMGFAELSRVLDARPDALRQRWSRAVRRLGERYRGLEAAEEGGGER